MISVLCPSRHRPEMLRESLLSLGDCEFLVAIDEDEDRGPYDLNRVPGESIIVTPRYGYIQLEKYYNKLAEKSSGDWLLNWNDDATMCTANWQERLSELDPSKPSIVMFEQSPLFPIMSRGLYELLGRYSPAPSIDGYLQAMALYGDIGITVGGVYIDHRKDEMRDDTANEKDYPKTMIRNEGPGMIAERFSDASKIWRWKAGL